MTVTTASITTPDQVGRPIQDTPTKQSWWRRRPTRWIAAVVLVFVLVVTTVLLLLASARSQQADDPRSTRPTGAAALAQLLDDQGVEVRATDRVDEAVQRSTVGSTLVVANAERLSDADAARLLAAPHDRLVLLRPTTFALRAFGLDVTTSSPNDGTVLPVCRNPDAQRAGSIVVDDMRAAYRAAGAAELACYPTGDGYALLRVRAGGRLVDLVAGGLSNATLAEEGNAAFATALLGTQADVVWLMTPRADAPDDTTPTLLPAWWQMAVVQAFLALVAVGIWRGRRLGPILVEPLPVTVRASETVEGHGRLYFRLGARERAAEALRTAARERLSRSFGHHDDPEQLSEVLASRTGQDVRSVQYLLDGPPPATDDDLRNLALRLDQLEQEARRL
ncbi:MAG: DUF4350 domain-containing protein [Propionibacteriaceae bacterium]